MGRVGSRWPKERRANDILGGICNQGSGRVSRDMEPDGVVAKGIGYLTLPPVASCGVPQGYSLFAVRWLGPAQSISQVMQAGLIGPGIELDRVELNLHIDNTLSLG